VLLASACVARTPAERPRTNAFNIALAATGAAVTGFAIYQDRNAADPCMTDLACRSIDTLAVTSVGIAAMSAAVAGLILTALGDEDIEPSRAMGSSTASSPQCSDWRRALRQAPDDSARQSIGLTMPVECRTRAINGQH
jgi:hypothetical protein